VARALLGCTRPFSEDWGSFGNKNGMQLLADRGSAEINVNAVKEVVPHKRRSGEAEDKWSGKKPHPKNNKQAGSRPTGEIAIQIPKAAFTKSAINQVRWRVLVTFTVPPSIFAAMRVTAAQVVVCQGDVGAHLPLNQGRFRNLALPIGRSRDTRGRGQSKYR